jgi:PhzF family phenazine biosynthesis protein
MSAFYKNQNGGNKAGVYIDADELSVEKMQEIAKEVGYSETAFVLKSTQADFKLRFFTPNNEVDLCGHATIATFNLLRDIGLIKEGLHTQETNNGILKLDVKKDLVFMEQFKPLYAEKVKIDDLLNCFENLELNKDFYPQIISTGMREIFLGVKNTEILNLLEPNFKKISEISKIYQTIGIHAFALDGNYDAIGRNFAPLVGINEESATGTSNGALACYLARYHQRKNKYIFAQGYTMNQPSEIIAKLLFDNNEISEVWVGGKAKRI